MIKVLLTGGNGDIAKAIIKKLRGRITFEVFAPSKDELDVTSIESVNRYLNNLSPDILINNAGYISPQSICESSILDEKKTIDINLFGIFNCTEAVLKVNRNALIVNIGSSAGTKAHAGWSSYCACKAGVIMATKCWAEEGVRALCISPGRTATKMRSQLFPDEEKDTLLTSEQLAVIVMNAIDGNYKYGINIDVNLQNIEELCNE